MCAGGSMCELWTWCEVRRSDEIAAYARRSGVGSVRDRRRCVRVPAGDGRDALANDGALRRADARALCALHLSRVPPRVQRVRATPPAALSAPLRPHTRALELSLNWTGLDWTGLSPVSPQAAWGQDRTGQDITGLDSMLVCVWYRRIAKIISQYTLNIRTRIHLLCFAFCFWEALNFTRSVSVIHTASSHILHAIYSTLVSRTSVNCFYVFVSKDMTPNILVYFTRHIFVQQIVLVFLQVFKEEPVYWITK